MERYYVSGCRDDCEATVTCDDSEATFWTLYARDDKGLSQGIIDLAFREDAEAAMAVYLERDALQEQVQKLAAEGAIMLRLLKDISENYFESQAESEDSIAVIDLDYISEVNIYISRDVEAENPFEATDAVIREIRAQGAIEVRDALVVADDGTDIYSVVSDVAARIRAGDQP